MKNAVAIVSNCSHSGKNYDDRIRNNTGSQIEGPILQSFEKFVHAMKNCRSDFTEKT
jgi:hypothetical protein